MISEQDCRHENLLNVAKLMLLAARTAPKGRGKDNLRLEILDAADIKIVAQKMYAMADEFSAPGFKRDADSLLKAELAVVMGTSLGTMGLKKCGMCGFPNCAEKEKAPHIPCVFNPGDLGIALGSAVRVAMDHCVDNRIMYTAGQAIMALSILGPEVKICYVVPLSSTGKNPFFDRTT